MAVLPAQAGAPLTCLSLSLFLSLFTKFWLESVHCCITVCFINILVGYPQISITSLYTSITPVNATEDQDLRMVIRLDWHFTAADAGKGCQNTSHDADTGFTSKGCDSSSPLVISSHYG
jgi:hypothetical protein